MKPTLSTFYDSDFYSEHQEGMANSAIHVLSLLYKYYTPKSVVDVGCGRGAWLGVAESLGSKQLKGFDGSWIKKEALLSENIDFTAINFEEGMPEIDKKYELCISLEVAEHIPERNAKLFVDFLCQTSDIVLFSAAIKYQGGINHINERWQSYWIDLFKAHGYECYDTLRSQLWSNESVKWWYRQNMFIFSRKNNGLINCELLRADEKPIYDIVHPINLEGWVKGLVYPTLSYCLRCIKRYAAINVRRLIGMTDRT